MALFLIFFAKNHSSDITLRFLCALNDKNTIFTMRIYLTRFYNKERQACVDQLTSVKVTKQNKRNVVLQI